MLRCRSRFAVFSLIYIFYSHIALSAQEKNTIASDLSSDADVLKAVKKLNEKGYLGQGTFLNTVKEAGAAGIPALKQNLNHPNPEVRRAILTSLWTIKAPCQEVSRNVTTLLLDENKWVRNNALYYLGSQRCVEAKTSIIGLLNTETDPDVLRNVVDSLGRIGGNEEIPILKEIQNSSSQPLRIRLSAARSLLMLGTECDSRLLQETLLNSDVNIVLAALGAYEYSPDQSALQTIQPLLNRPEPIKSRAANVMESIKINRIDWSENQKIERLFHYIETDESKQRWAVDHLIHRFAQPEIIAQLKSIAFDSKKKGSQVIAEELIVLGVLNQSERRNYIEKLYSTQKSEEK